MNVLDICVKKVEDLINKIDNVKGSISLDIFEGVVEPALTDIQKIALHVADMQASIELNSDDGITQEQESEVRNAGLCAIKALNDINMELDRLLA